MWLAESMHEKEYSDVLHKNRVLLDKVYDQGYQSVKELYGRSNDDAGGPDELDGIELPPMNVSGTRDPLPYVPPLDPTEEGYPGLEPPVG